MKPYRPTRGDLGFRDRSAEADPFEKAILLRGVSRSYLLVLIHDNATGRSMPFKAMLDAELAYRNAATARLGNMIAALALTVAVISILISILR